MKHFYFFLLRFIILLIFNINIVAQTIPYGSSFDTITIEGSQGTSWQFEIYYYKPSNYDSINSPILWGMHGLESDGSDAIWYLKNIADRRNALIVAPTALYMSWAYVFESFTDSSCGPPYNRYYIDWLPLVFKQIYNHVSDRENRDSVPVYLTGFSAGGQLVSRYMLVRQAVFDSIPVQMAVSVSPYFYSFCTDTLNSIDMPHPCGLSLTHSMSYVDCDTTTFLDPIILDFICNEHVILYYNENYVVLIGSADTTGAEGVWACQQAQGSNRYERAQNFYDFSESDAIARGTTLKWQYTEIPDVGHNGYDMYNTKASPSDTSTIAETLLFDSPHHEPLEVSPNADFNIETAFCDPKSIKLTVSCIMSGITYIWDFGDGSNATGPEVTHTYSDEGLYQIQLTAYNSIETDIVTEYYYVNDLLEADFIADNTNIFLPDATVNFTNLSVSANNFIWDFGDGSLDTCTETNPTYTYTHQGIYSVTLYAFDNEGCADTLIKENYITVDTLDGINDFEMSNQISIAVFPNPFTDKTNIKFQIPEEDHVIFEVYNYMGQCISTIFNKLVKPDQEYTVKFNSDNLPDGIYFGILQTSKERIIRKMLIIK